EDGIPDVHVTGVQNGALPVSLGPGLLARVELVLARKDAVLSVPREALLQGPQGPYVYVVEDNRAVTRPLTVGLEGSERVEVLAALGRAASRERGRCAEPPGDS